MFQEVTLPPSATAWLARPVPGRWVSDEPVWSRTNGPGASTSLKSDLPLLIYCQPSDLTDKLNLDLCSVSYNYWTIKFFRAIWFVDSKLNVAMPCYSVVHISTVYWNKNLQSCILRSKKILLPMKYYCWNRCLLLMWHIFFFFFECALPHLITFMTV